jgi:hypothetical protein
VKASVIQVSQSEQHSHRPVSKSAPYTMLCARSGWCWR